MPIPHYETVPRGIGELQVADMVQLCLDPVSERCWLRLRNFASVYPGLSGDEVIDVYVGAIKQKDTWIPMDPGRRPSTFLMFDLAGACGSARKITEFQRAIISDWQRFDGANLSHFAKGTTFGKSYTSASFAAKALKTGFDAVGLPAPAYSGVKASGWSVADLRKYAQVRQGMLGFRDKDMLSMSDLVSDFMELPPITRYESKEEPAVPAAAFPDKLIAPILAARNQSGPFAYAQELKNIPFPRMTAYGFRGDTRAPLKFKAEIRVAATGQTRSWMQGFLPNYTRPTHNEQVQAFKGTDAYKANPAATNAVWAKADGKGKSVADVDKGAFDLQNYIANEFMGGYISLTRYAMIARSFACGMGGTVASTAGWVYCCLAEGAFSVPRKGQHPWATKNEAELAMPGLLEWEDIMGFRQVTQNGLFSGPVYLRRSFHAREPQACQQVLQIFSGKNQ